MGNCGFSLAPCAAKDKHYVVRNLERAEDIAGEAMEVGIDWTWETFPQYLDSIALEYNLKIFFRQPLANEDQDHVLKMMKHPRSVVTFSDSGTHVSQIMDSSLQTHVLSHWVREKQALTLEEAVQMLTKDIAAAWGFKNRGQVKQGYAADILIFDEQLIAPLMPVVKNDLPASARRLVQKAVGISVTIVNGEVLMRNGEHTGAYPGKLLRGPLAETA